MPRECILVVEDDDDLRHIFRESLRYAGFDVQEASDGPAALLILEDSTPDAVVLDMGLPTLDGMSVRDEMAATARTRHIPVVIVTGATVDATRVGTARVLRKPVTPEELVAAVRMCLARL